jgi:hypothetical protein
MGMKPWSYHQVGHLAFLVVLVLLTIVATNYLSTTNTPVAEASCTGGTGAGTAISSLTGYAWSDTTGWMCMGMAACPTAAVAINPNGTLTGYAWSDSIGWIQFGGLSTAAMPTGAGTQSINAQLTGTTFSGWVRAIAADNNLWDGWISLGGTGYGLSASGGQSVSGPVAGYAWGGDVVGWVDGSLFIIVAQNPIAFAFNPAFVPARDRVRSGEGTTLSWSATCMSSCSVKDQDGNTLAGSNVTSATAVPTGALTKSTTFTLTCLDAGNVENKATANVGIVPIVKEI